MVATYRTGDVIPSRGWNMFRHLGDYQGVREWGSIRPGIEYEGQISLFSVGRCICCRFYRYAVQSHTLTWFGASGNTKAVPVRGWRHDYSILSTCCVRSCLGGSYNGRPEWPCYTTWPLFWSLRRYIPQLGSFHPECIHSRFAFQECVVCDR